MDKHMDDSNKHLSDFIISLSSSTQSVGGAKHLVISQMAHKVMKQIYSKFLESLGELSM